MPTLSPHPLDSFYSTSDWLEVRDAALERDGYRCTVARLFGGECHEELHVHHIRSVADYPEQALDLDNVATACKSHHPMWERLRRELTGEAKVPPCRHRHPYRQGAIDCLNQRRARVGLPPVDVPALV